METFSETYGEGKPILYLHGWGASGSIFKPVVNCLPNYENVMIDFAGFGSSPPPPSSGYTVFDYAEQVAGFLEEKSLKNTVIVAHSFGCRVAMVLAVLYPQFVDRMLLFAPAGLRRFSLKRWFKVRFYKLRKRLFKGSNTDCGSDDYRNCSGQMKNTLIKVVNCDLSAYARRVGCKTHIIAAIGDTAVPFCDAKRLHRLIKNSDFTAIDGDHFALFYVPKTYARIIQMFVEE